MSKEEKIYYIKQKICGGVLVAAAVALPVFLQEITASIFLFPLGVGVMVTKDKVI